MSKTVTSNTNEIIRELTDIERNQIPYATSLALNNTAEIAMLYMTKKIDKDFNVTAKWNKVGGRAGIKKKRATKNKHNVEIYIPSANHWIQDHEDGETREGNIFIPTKGFKYLYPSIRTNRAIKKKAKTLLSNKSRNRIFEAKLNGGKGNSTKAIFQRVKGKDAGTRRLRSKKTGRLLKTKKVFGRTVIPIFIIKQSVKQNAILDFNETIFNVFNNKFEIEFGKAFDYAINTSK